MKAACGMHKPIFSMFCMSNSRSSHVASLANKFAAADGHLACALLFMMSFFCVNLENYSSRVQASCILEFLSVVLMLVVATYHVLVAVGNQQTESLRARLEYEASLC